MKMSNVALALSGVVFGGVLLSSHASAAEGRLVVYCSAQNTMCEQETMAFEKKYGATEQRKALIEKWVQDVKLAK